MVKDLDLAAGCRGRTDDGDSVPDVDPPSRGFGFWANLMTTRETRTVEDPRPTLGGVTAPVLVMRGECDYISWEITREYRDVLTNAVLVSIDDAGHAISTDRPELYREHVGAFLRDEDLPLEPYTGDAEPWGR